MSLAEQACIPCRGGTPPLDPVKRDELLAELGGDWRLNSDGHLECRYRFDDFAQAMVFANRVAEIAESENHHPDLQISWGRCVVEIWTHKISGLTESDFFFAAKVDRATQA